MNHSSPERPGDHVADIGLATCFTTYNSYAPGTCDEAYHLHRLLLCSSSNVRLKRCLVVEVCWHLKEKMSTKKFQKQPKSCIVPCISLCCHDDRLLIHYQTTPAKRSYVRHIVMIAKILSSCRSPSYLNNAVGAQHCAGGLLPFGPCRTSHLRSLL